MGYEYKVRIIRYYEIVSVCDDKENCWWELQISICT